MQTTSRQRPSLTINAKKASQVNNNPYQTPQGSTTNFGLFQGSQNPITPIATNYVPKSGPPNTIYRKSGSLNDSKISVLSDEDDFYGRDEDESDRLSVSMYSDSSMNSSFMDHSEMTQPKVKFTKKFESLLFNNYQNYIVNPQITPFSGRYPPSGIVSKVSRESLRAALAQNTQIDSKNKNSKFSSTSSQSALLSAIRQKLIEMCLQYYNMESRNGSVSSLTSLNYLNNSNGGYNGNGLDEGFSSLNINGNQERFHILTTQNYNNNSPGNFQYVNNQLTSPQLSPINHNFSPINSTFDNFFVPDINPTSPTVNTSNSIHESLSNYINQSSRKVGNGNPPLTPITPITQNINGNRLLSPTFEASGARNFPKNSGLMPQTKPFTLSSPFKETFEKKNLKKSLSSKSIESHDSGSGSSVRTIETNNEDVNMTSKRKRNSLKLKRFGKN